MNKNPSAYSVYRDHPRTCQPDDFWGQVKRTVNGKPVPQDQIDLIIKAVNDGLRLEPEDHLLDLCCGNGALTTHFFQRCAGGLGVDFSDILIDIAQRHFQRRPGEAFRLEDVVGFVERETDTSRYTKALCYGAFQYLEATHGERMLSALRQGFQNLKILYIGNLPDRERMEDFSRRHPRNEVMENRADSLIGLWRTSAEFVALAGSTGWRAEIRHMPESFYAAHYRFDAILYPA